MGLDARLYMGVSGGVAGGLQVGCSRVAGGLQGGSRLVNDLDYGVGRSRGSVRWPGDQ